MKLSKKLPEKTEDDPETMVSQTYLKLPEAVAENITFHHVHHLGSRPRLIIANCEHFKQKELVKSHSQELRAGLDWDKKNIYI